MKRSSIVLTALAVVLYFGAMTVFAQHGGGHGGGSGHGALGMGHESMETHEGHGPSSGKSESMRGDHEGRESSLRAGSKTPDQLLARNTKLASKLQPLLPAGTNLQTAAGGFKNLGQFVAAVHVSKDLGIPFNQLKAKTTGPNAVSLGKAISELKPGANAKEEAKEANKEAKEDIEEARESGS